MEIIVFQADEVFVEPNYDSSAERIGTQYGAKESHNLDQITYYFETRFCDIPACVYNGIEMQAFDRSNLRRGWAEVRPKIESLLNSGKTLLGEFNGSPIAGLLPDKSGWRSKYHADPSQYETVSFWMDDDFTRVWVFGHDI